MVERLKQAIDKARSQRADRVVSAAAGAAADAPAAPDLGVATIWDDLTMATPSEADLARARLVSALKSDAAYVAFDLLRTRVLSTFRERGWRRLGISSPTAGCGKSFVSLNLAFSAARNRTLKVALLEFDLRRPSLARALGLPASACVGDMLRGAATAAEVFVRVEPNLAVAAVRRPEAESAELLQSANTAAALAAALDLLDADLVILDLPPALSNDDVLSALPHMDALMLVAAAGATHAKEVKDCERLVGDGAAFLGVVLNKAAPADVDLYEMAYHAGT